MGRYVCVHQTQECRPASLSSQVHVAEQVWKTYARVKLLVTPASGNLTDAMNACLKTQVSECDHAVAAHQQQNLPHKLQTAVLPHMSPSQSSRDLLVPRTIAPYVHM